MPRVETLINIIVGLVVIGTVLYQLGTMGQQLKHVSSEVAHINQLQIQNAVMRAQLSEVRSDLRLFQVSSMKNPLD